MQDITWIVLAIMAICTVASTRFLIPYLKTKQSKEEWLVTASKAKKVTGWIVTAVQAAEMIFKGFGLGDVKNQYVLNFVKTLCEKYEITFDVDEVSAKIEETGQNLGLWGVEKDENKTK